MRDALLGGAGDDFIEAKDGEHNYLESGSGNKEASVDLGVRVARSCEIRSPSCLWSRYAPKRSGESPYGLGLARLFRRSLGEVRRIHLRRKSANKGKGNDRDSQQPRSCVPLGYPTLRALALGRCDRTSP